MKDLFAVRGHRIGAGNPAYLHAAPEQTVTADAVARLLAAGASVAGIARTDEFAYSLAGTNAHYGAPPNGIEPSRIPGGSSSGPASAVALGLADIGLGTDTGGSVRVPASYQGLYGIRTTHGLVSSIGMVPLAQSFDTVGWLTREPELLSRVTRVMAGAATGAVRRAAFAPALTAVADPDVASRVRDAVARWRRGTGLPPLLDLPWDAAAQAAAVRAFQTVQGGEAWANHGTWIGDHWDSLNPDVRARFEKAASYTPADRSEATARVQAFRTAFDQRLGDAVLVLPSSSSRAPRLSAATLGGPAIEAARSATFQLTCIAGITGRPAVSVPLAADPGIGLCLVGPRGTDAALAALAVRLRASGVAR